eukprot:264282_1
MYYTKLGMTGIIPSTGQALCFTNKNNVVPFDRSVFCVSDVTSNVSIHVFRNNDLLYLIVKSVKKILFSMADIDNNKKDTHLRPLRPLFNAVYACNTAEKCGYWNKLCNEMKQYESKSNKNEKKPVEAYYDNIIEILDCFHHLRTKHTHIYQTFGGECDLLQCAIVKRHISHRTTRNKLDHRSQFAQQTMDQIHCDIRHEHHFGTRFTPEEVKAIGVDRTIAIGILRRRQEILHEHFNYDRFTNSNNKYVSTMNQLEFSNNTYSYSLPFNYQPECRDRHEVCWNGLTYSQLYVPPKYESLKEELLAHSSDCILYVLDYKAKRLAQTQAAKEIKANCQNYLKQKSNEPDHPSKYKYEDGSSLTVAHIAVVVIYCDNDAFQYGFSQSYRPIYDDEKQTDDDGLLSILNNIKSRNSEYYHFAKLLKETVEVFGTQYIDHKGNDWPKRMYHGIQRRLVLPGFQCKIFGVLSATTEWHVAERFAEGDHDGLILEMVPSVHLKSFYCRPFSTLHLHEEEHLFVGGLEQFNIMNIEQVPRHRSKEIARKRYPMLIPEAVAKDVITALRVIDCMTNGIYFSNDSADYYHVISKGYVLTKLLKFKDITDTVKDCAQKLMDYRLMAMEHTWSLSEISALVAMLLKEMCDVFFNQNSPFQKSRWTIQELSAFVAKLLTAMFDAKRCIQIHWESLHDELRRIVTGTGGYAGYSFLKSTICTNDDSQCVNITKINKLFPFMLNLVVHEMDMIEAAFLADILQYIQNRDEQENRRIDCFDLLMARDKDVDEDTFNKFLKEFELVKVQGDTIWEAVNTSDTMLQRKTLIIRIVPQKHSALRTDHNQENASQRIESID